MAIKPIGNYKKHKDVPGYYNWKNMNARCRATSGKNKEHYTDKGITVCEEWLKFENFFKDMGPKPFDKASIERVDCSKGYSPDNCTWANQTEQVRNSSKVEYHTYRGEYLCIPELAEKYNIKANSIHKSLYNGHSIEIVMDTLISKQITYKGETRTKKEWAIHLGINPSTLYARFSRGLSVEEALKV